MANNPPNVQVPQVPQPPNPPAPQPPLPQNPPPPVVVQPNVAFALSPALAQANIIDYTTSEGMKIYSSATASLFPSDDEKFNCEPEKLLGFLDLLDFRSTLNGWDNSIMAIPDNPVNPLGPTKYFIRHFGEYSLEHLQQAAAVYVTAQNRAAQDSMQCVGCILNSLGAVGRNKITTHRDEYTVNGVISGICLLKVLIRESSIDTNATTAHIRAQLSSLDTYLPTIGHDISKLNLYVQQKVEALAARGETTNDLLVNLFKGYHAASDRRFVAYIEKKEEEYEDGTTPLTPNTLMALAKNRYEVLLEKGQWNAPSAEEEKILALEATLKRMQSQQQRANKSRSTDSNDKAAAGKGKGNKKKKKDPPAWVSIKPKEGEPTHKTVDGKDWWYCTNHQKWCRHSTDKCEKKGLGKRENKPQTSTSTSPNKETKFAKAMTALADIAESSEE